MAIYVSNLVIEQGFDFQTTFVLEDTVTTNFLDLTGYVIESQLRKTYSSSEKISFDAIASDVLGGTVTISLASTITSSLKEGRYVYDVKAVTGSGGGTVLKLVEGAALVRPGVTR